MPFLIKNFGSKLFDSKKIRRCWIFKTSVSHKRVKNENKKLHIVPDDDDVM